MKKILQEQDDLQRQDVARILSWAYKVLPVCYALIITIRVISGHWVIALSMTGALVVIPVANHFLKKGKIETSLVILTISLILALNVALTFSNGIHDIGILTFPIILLISSLMLRLWQQILTFLLVLISVGWLALGEGYGYYKPDPIGESDLSDLIIIILIIVVSTLICYRISSNLRNALKARDREVHLTSTKLDLLQNSLTQKIKLTNAVHLQVVDSINIIRELLSNQKAQSFQNLPQQLLTIELVHAELYRLELEKELDLENYLDALFAAQSSRFGAVKKNEFDDVMVNVDQAMSLGMLFTELSLLNDLKGDLNLHLTNGNIQLKITAMLSPLVFSTLAEIMVRQLNAEVSNDKDSFQLSFQTIRQN